MQIHIPDSWTILEFRSLSNGLIHYKVLAGWFGESKDSDSWRLSSGITGIIEDNGHWEIHNESGSVYQCMKVRESFGDLTQVVYDKYVIDNKYEFVIKHVGISNILNKLLLYKD